MKNSTNQWNKGNLKGEKMCKSAKMAAWIIVYHSSLPPDEYNHTSSLFAILISSAYHSGIWGIFLHPSDIELRQITSFGQWSVVTWNIINRGNIYSFWKKILLFFKSLSEDIFSINFREIEEKGKTERNMDAREIHGLVTSCMRPDKGQAREEPANESPTWDP